MWRSLARSSCTGRWVSRTDKDKLLAHDLWGRFLQSEIFSKIANFLNFFFEDFRESKVVHIKAFAVGEKLFTSRMLKFKDLRSY